MNKKLIFAIAGALSLIIVLLVFMLGGLGSNSVRTWQVKQSVSGEVTIVDKPGYYMKMFADVWDYPRSIQTFYSSHSKEGNSGDDSISVTFNDGGNAKISTMVRFDMPSDETHRLLLHRTFGNANECKTLIDSVRAHLVNCLKNSAPLMSASENQAGRKAEFNRIVEEQLRHGLYKMRIAPKVVQDLTDQTGHPVTVYATEVVTDDKGSPVIQQTSPLDEYGIVVTQFSVTGTEYDDAIQKQFAAKKDSFLNAEQSKAQREQEVQQRLMIVEQGLREKAEAEAKANKEKATAVIAAQLKAEVAEQEKKEAETKANQALSVAKIEKQEAETRAEKELSVAQIRTKAAEQEALAIKTLADAKAEQIKKAGSITEREQTLATILADRDAKIAQALSTVRTPQVWMSGSGTNGGDVQNNLLSIALLRWAGIDLAKTQQIVNSNAEQPSK